MKPLKTKKELSVSERVGKIRNILKKQKTIEFTKLLDSRVEGKILMK